MADRGTDGTIRSQWYSARLQRSAWRQCTSSPQMEQSGHDNVWKGQANHAHGWRQSVAHIRRASMANGMYTVYSSSIYFRRAEDISIEFVPNYIEANANKAGQETAMFNLRGAMGQPIGVWNIEEWQRIDNEAQATIWLDHSISAWSQSETQWHLNEFSAITMCNTHSMSRTFRNWCEQNNLMAVLNKYLEADGTIKQQYVMANNGVEHNHNQAMALHRWQRDNHMVLTINRWQFASTVRAMEQSCSGQAQ
eukprot:6492555-Amphidinium_carterae.5